MGNKTIQGKVAEPLDLSGGGRVVAQNSSWSNLLGRNWNLEKSIATGTHNSKPLDHLERRLAAPAEEDWAR